MLPLKIEKLVTDNGGITKQKTSRSKKDKQITEIENQLREKLGILVEISHSQAKKNGKIILKYSNLDVLDGLLKKLGYKK